MSAQSKTTGLKGAGILLSILLLASLAAPAAAWTAGEMDKAKAGGVQWLRRDLFKGDQGSKDFVSAAAARGISVMGIVKSDPFKPYVSYWYPCGWKMCFYDWGAEWKNYVKAVVNENKYWVKDWQCDNELNHAGHNSYTAVNKALRKDVIRICVQGVLEADPAARTVLVNLYYGDGFDNSGDITLYRDLRNSGVRMDALAIDIYRATYSTGNPTQYGSDFTGAHNIWGGNMLMGETGFCTFSARSYADQSNYVVQTYSTLSPAFQAANPWFKGTLFYESSDAKSGTLNCEENFGLLKSDHATEKTAWATFVNYNKACSGFCGLTMH